MSTIWGIIYLAGLIRLVDYILSKKPAPVKEEKKNSIPQPTANLDKRPLSKCYHLLKLDDEPTFTLTDVNKAYYKRLQEMSELERKRYYTKIRTERIPERQNSNDRFL
jgi:hypothetical protein